MFSPLLGEHMKFKIGVISFRLELKAINKVAWMSQRIILLDTNRAACQDDHRHVQAAEPQCSDEAVSDQSCPEMLKPLTSSCRVLDIYICVVIYTVWVLLIIFFI